MASIAIVIAVSDYQANAALPACRQDGVAFADLLRRAGRFDEVVHISGGNETVSAAVKARLSAVADQFRGTLVDEVVFYFSGHGDFDGQEFRYLLTDYSSKRPNQTALSNTELDGIFRGLQPTLFVKIVDACNSGISYIKSDDDFAGYLKGTRTGFKNIYFMFSSQAEQSSYATEKVSYFTHSILKAVAAAPDGPLRYRDIMSAASDDFAAKGAAQTPQFVVQATNTEVFCDVNETIRSAMRPFVAEEEVPAKEPDKGSTLLQRIQKDEADVCTQEEAAQILEDFPDAFLKLKLSDDLKPLFEVEVEEHSGIAPSGNAIGVWLNENPEYGYFAKPTKRSEEYTERVPKGLAGAIASLSLAGVADDSNYREVTRYRQVVDSYRITTEQPYGHLVVELNPKMKALAPFKCVIAPVISRSDMTLFWRYLSYDYSDWNKTVQSAGSKWARAETKLRDEGFMKLIIDDIWTGFQSFVLNQLLERWPAPETSEDSIEGASHGVEDALES